MNNAIPFDAKPEPLGPATPKRRWRKSSFSNGNGACVEVSYDVGTVLIRDSKYRHDLGNDMSAEPIITIPAQAWATFLAEVETGEREYLNGALTVEHAADGIVTILRSEIDGTTLVYTSDEWSAYVSGVNAHEFDYQANLTGV